MGILKHARLKFEVRHHVRDQATGQHVLLTSYFPLRSILRSWTVLTHSSTRTGFECTGLIKGLKEARTTPTCVTVGDMLGGLTLKAQSAPKSGENLGTALEGL